MNTFLPDDYKVPTESNYMKFKDGINKFRILDKPIVGFEVWVDGEKNKRKPVRARNLIELQSKAPLIDYKHFWAIVVWNYQESKVQILEITQKGIQLSLTSLINDEDWGSPLNYDIVVTRTGQKLETEYSVQPKPAKEVDKSILDTYEKSNIKLDALYEGADPFETISNGVMSKDESDALVNDAINNI